MSASAENLVVLRAEAEDDADGVRAVVRAAFDDGHRVADLVAALRTHPGRLAARGFVATIEDRIVGYVLLSGALLDAPRELVDVLVLSPLAVAPEVQRRGVGTRLVRHALEAAAASGVALVFLEGSPRYYARSGFRPAEDLGFRRPSLRIPAAAFQVVTLPAYRPWMTGTLVYPDTFWTFDLVGLRTADVAGGGVTVQVADGERLVVAGRLLDAFNREYDDPSPGPAALAARLGELVRSGDTAVLLAEDATGDAVGLAVLRFRPALWDASLEAYLAELYVVPERRGGGIGSAVLQACIDHALGRGARYMDLTTTEDDVGARHLYEKFGFGRSEGRVGGPLSFYYERVLNPD